MMIAISDLTIGRGRMPPGQANIKEIYLAHNCEQFDWSMHVTQ